MSQQKAFTLIELLVIIVVISILTGFVIVQTNNSINAGKDVKRKADIELLANAVTTYSSENYAPKPIVADGCNIGAAVEDGGCNTDVITFLEAYLPNLPIDPDSGNYYTYASTDGKSCQIYAKLSTPAPNDIYAYNCDTNDYSIGTVIVGACGDFSTEYTSTNGYNNPSATDWPTITDTSFCSTGTLDGTTPVFPEEGASVSWYCKGDYSGGRASCSAYRALNGVCGSANGTNSYTSPTTNLCNPGNASLVSGSGPWTWTCVGLNGGTTSSTCTVNKIEDGVCGSANGSYYPSAPTTNLCNPGNASLVSGSGPWTWTCASTNGGATSGTCTASKSVDGVCGSANGSYYPSAPTTNLCNPGNASSVSGSGPWTWTCASTNGGATSGTCTASKSVDGVCGSANGTNSYTSPTTNLCNPGNASLVSGSGPWTWTCASTNGGATSGTCTVNKKVDGVCGTRSKTYAWNVTTYGSDTICTTAGASTPASPAFPNQGQTITWTCPGSNDGTTANCSASRPAAVAGECTLPDTYSNINPFSCGPHERSSKVNFSDYSWCVSGNMINLSPDNNVGPWTWQCTGSDGGATVNCSASHTSNYHPDHTCGYAGRTLANCTTHGGYLDWSICDGCGMCKNAEPQTSCQFLIDNGADLVPYGLVNVNGYSGCI